MEFKPRAKRSLTAIIEDQAKKWELNEKKKFKQTIRPVIAISRLPGSGGWFLAQRVAKDLKMDYWDRQIIDEVAKSAKVSKRLIKSLDEQDRSMLDDWIESLGERHVWPYEFMEHLTKVIGAIGAHGNAVIVGRGASFILPPEACLRVFVIAPLDVRVNNVSTFFKVSKEEAKQRILSVEAERIAFARKYFNLDPLEPSHYDLIINTQYFNLDEASRIIIAAYESKDWQDFSAKKVIK
ncbi:MAG TPA: cytidylate kinase-like family protein [Syntrophales bacterium]|nr:cytidylate kinase-like family protein [Syntrophales bacterium]